jgi:hypothetical protein
MELKEEIRLQKEVFDLKFSGHEYAIGIFTIIREGSTKPKTEFGV